MVSPVLTNLYTYVGIGIRTIPARPVDRVGARELSVAPSSPRPGWGPRFLPATKAVPKELLPIGDTPLLQIVIDEALGAGIDHVVVVSSRSKPGIEAYFEDRPEVIEALEEQGRHELAERIRSIGSDWRATIVYQDQPRGLGHAVGCAREAVGDQPFAVMLPDELMGDSSLLAHMNGVCVSSGGSVVALKRVPQEDVGAYGVIEPLSPVDPDGVVAIGGMVEKPDPADGAERPDHHRALRAHPRRVRRDRHARSPGRSARSSSPTPCAPRPPARPFHGVLSEIERFDTGTPIGYLQAAISITMRRPDFGDELALRCLVVAGRRTAARHRAGPTATGVSRRLRRKRSGSSTTRPNSSTSNRRTAPLASAVRRYVRSPRRS